MLKKEVTKGMDPLSILKQAVVTVPSLKYALGIVGIAAAIAIIKSFQIDYQIAVSGTVVMLILMAVLVIFSKVARFSQGDLRIPALVLTWFALILVIATACALFLSIFANWPKGFQELLRSFTLSPPPIAATHLIELPSLPVEKPTSSASASATTIPNVQEAVKNKEFEKDEKSTQTSSSVATNNGAAPTKAEEPQQVRYQSMKKYFGIDLALGDAFENVTKELSGASFGEKNDYLFTIVPVRFLDLVPGSLTVFVRGNKIFQFSFIVEEDGSVFKQYRLRSDYWETTREATTRAEELDYNKATIKCAPLLDNDIKSLFTREFGMTTKTISQYREYGLEDLQSDTRVTDIFGKGATSWHYEYFINNASISAKYYHNFVGYTKKNTYTAKEEVRIRSCKLRLDFKL